MKRCGVTAGTFSGAGSEVKNVCCRDICSWQLLQEPISLGGPGRIVQIDESLLVRAKYNRGHQLRARQRWVFGVYDPQLKQGFVQLVDDRSADTLLPIIQRTVQPGKLNVDMYT